MSSSMANVYVEFVLERHKIWQLRELGMPAPWTTDPVLHSRKFTNVFRVLDTGSQFLLRELLEDPDITAEDALFRSYLYRITNLPEPWEYFLAIHGRYPLVEDLETDWAETWKDYVAGGNQLFSGAYIIRPHPTVKGVDKLTSVKGMVGRMFGPESGGTLAAKFVTASTMQERFQLLRDQPGIGDFIAMQVLTDYGYSRFGSDQDENAFIVPGPGAINGALEITDAHRATDVIYWARAELLELEGDCPTLDGRPPSLMDVQNTLCEFSKYTRYLRAGAWAGPGKPYSSATRPKTGYTLPGHWGVII